MPFGTAAIARVTDNPYSSHADSISVLRALFAVSSSLSIRRRTRPSVECLSNSSLDAILKRRTVVMRKRDSAARYTIRASYDDITRPSVVSV